MKTLVGCITLALSPLLAAAPMAVSAPAEVEKILSQIPVTDKDFGYRNLGERLPNVGLKVESIRLDRVGKEDAEPPLYRAGDQVIVILTNTPNAVVQAICPIAGNPEYIKRGGRYIPINRTAYWLMHNRCDFK